MLWCTICIFILYQMKWELETFSVIILLTKTNTGLSSFKFLSYIPQGLEWFCSLSWLLNCWKYQHWFNQSLLNVQCLFDTQCLYIVLISVQLGSSISYGRFGQQDYGIHVIYRDHKLIGKITVASAPKVCEQIKSMYVLFLYSLVLPISSLWSWPEYANYD